MGFFTFDFLDGVSNGLHEQTVTSPELITLLICADCSHIQTVESPVLASKLGDDCSQTVTSIEPTLVHKHILSPSNCSHSLTSPVVYLGFIISNNGNISQTVSSPSIFQVWTSYTIQPKTTADYANLLYTPDLVDETVNTITIETSAADVEDPTEWNNIATVSIGAGGSGYTVNDILTITQSGASDGKVKVLTLGGGNSVATVEINDPGVGYDVKNLNATTGGTGTLCTIDIDSVDSPYEELASITFTSGGYLTQLSAIDTYEITTSSYPGGTCNWYWYYKALLYDNTAAATIFENIGLIGYVTEVGATINEGINSFVNLKGSYILTKDHEYKISYSWRKVKSNDVVDEVALTSYERQLVVQEVKK